jgi:hypothetical protein
MKSRFRMKQIAAITKYPRYSLLIYFFASSPFASSWITRVGIRKPTPIPNKLIPTITAVAKAR